MSEKENQVDEDMKDGHIETAGIFKLFFSLLECEWWPGMYFDFALLRIGDRALFSAYRYLPDGALVIDALFVHVR